MTPVTLPLDPPLVAGDRGHVIHIQAVYMFNAKTVPRQNEL